MKILMLMRDNAFSHRGGDTVVLENLSKELIALGHQVTIDVNGVEDLKKFDIAHLFNFATREKLELLARRCVATGIKFVVTTLYEDWPKFFNQMIIQELLLAGYVKTGQPIQQWESFEGKALTSNPSPIQDNTYAALSAQILVPSGYNESVSLRRDYPDAGPIRVCNYGYQISSYTDGGKLFKETYNVDNYILCVGRLEQRKNQLSLLKALETSDHTIVFAGGGFSYEENYAAACNKARENYFSWKSFL